MKMVYLLLLLVLAWPVVPSLWAAHSLPPALVLASDYRPGLALGGYWVSEKLDGVRVYWDGRQLRTRGGMTITAPAGLLARLSSEPLDGELWMGRGRFDQVSALVRTQDPRPGSWDKVRLMVFDLPRVSGPFDARRLRLDAHVAALGLPWVHAVAQRRVEDPAQLERLLSAVVEGGGEGLMLRRGDAPYRAGRSEDLLKFKRYQDAEAVVVGHTPGKGRLEGMMGALLVRTDAGLVFRLGSGFSDIHRRNPPALGSLVSYRYNGLTPAGKPRFARFLRVREIF